MRRCPKQFHRPKRLLAVVAFWEPERPIRHKFISSASIISVIDKLLGEGYPDRPDPRVRLGRRETDLLDAVLMAEDALMLVIPEAHRALVGRLLVMTRWPDAGGFRWDAVRRGLLARAKDDERVPAPDALRMRDDRAVALVAGAMAKRGWPQFGGRA